MARFSTLTGFKAADRVWAVWRPSMAPDNQISLFRLWMLRPRSCISWCSVTDRRLRWERSRNLLDGPQLLNTKTPTSPANAGNSNKIHFSGNVSVCRPGWGALGHKSFPPEQHRNSSSICLLCLVTCSAECLPSLHLKLQLHYRLLSGAIRVICIWQMWWCYAIKAESCLLRRWQSGLGSGGAAAGFLQHERGN